MEIKHLKTKVVEQEPFFFAGSDKIFVLYKNLNAHTKKLQIVTLQ